MRTNKPSTVVCLAMLATFCWGQALEEWKRFRSKRLNDCPTSIMLQRTADEKDRHRIWVCVTIVLPSRKPSISYDELQFTAFDEKGAALQAEMSKYVDEKRRYDEGLDTQRTGYYNISLAPHQNVAAIKIEWKGKDVTFRMSEAIYNGY